MAETTSQDASQQIQNNGGLWGSIVGTVGDLANGFNYQKQENDIELARINAERARAEAEANNGGLFGMNKRYIYIGVGIVILIIGFMLFKKSE